MLDLLEWPKNSPTRAFRGTLRPEHRKPDSAKNRGFFWVPRGSGISQYRVKNHYVQVRKFLNGVLCGVLFAFPSFLGGGVGYIVH